MKQIASTMKMRTLLAIYFIIVLASIYLLVFSVFYILSQIASCSLDENTKLLSELQISKEFKLELTSQQQHVNLILQDSYFELNKMMELYKNIDKYYELTGSFGSTSRQLNHDQEIELNALESNPKHIHFIQLLNQLYQIFGFSTILSFGGVENQYVFTWPQYTLQHDLPNWYTNQLNQAQQNQYLLSFDQDNITQQFNIQLSAPIIIDANTTAVVASQIKLADIKKVIIPQQVNMLNYLLIDHFGTTQMIDETLKPLSLQGFNNHDIDQILNWINNRQYNNQCFTTMADALCLINKTSNADTLIFLHNFNSFNMTILSVLIPQSEVGQDYINLDLLKSLFEKNLEQMSTIMFLGVVFVLCFTTIIANALQSTIKFVLKHAQAKIVQNQKIIVKRTNVRFQCFQNNTVAKLHQAYLNLVHKFGVKYGKSVECNLIEKGQYPMTPFLNQLSVQDCLIELNEAIDGL